MVWNSLEFPHLGNLGCIQLFLFNFLDFPFSEKRLQMGNSYATCIIVCYCQLYIYIYIYVFTWCIGNINMMLPKPKPPCLDWLFYCRFLVIINAFFLGKRLAKTILAFLSQCSMIRSCLSISIFLIIRSRPSKHPQ